ncbi:MAG: pilus assembly protein [Salinibacterium sp.]|nr:TadE/TadG family type IV pilus assembly protein [Salinibacterium sp.]MBF0672759.1 pilus assembly protein [Salinibacterium sp.]
MRRMRGDERGAVAVEFALVVPVLLMVIFAIVEFGLIYNAQIQVTASAREGARAAALGAPLAQVKSTAVAAAPSLSPTLTAANVAVSPSTCAPGTNVTVTIVNYRLNSISGMFTGGIELSGKAVMRCGA